MILKHKNCKVIERRDLYKMVDNAEKSYNEVHSSLTIKPLINMSVGNSDITAPINDDICKRGWHERDRGTDTVGLRGQVIYPSVCQPKRIFLKGRLRRESRFAFVHTVHSCTLQPPHSPFLPLSVSYLLSRTHSSYSYKSSFIASFTHILSK